MIISATLSGVTVAGTDAAGCVWTVGEEEGLFDGPSMRVSSEPRPGGHGGFQSPGYQTPRTVTLAGMVVAPSEGALLVAIAALSRTMADGDMGSLVWSEGDVAWELGVQRTMIRTERLDVRAARWQAVLLAPDPRKYGPTQTLTAGARVAGSGGLAYPLAYPLAYGIAPSGGVVSLVNSGSAPSEPVITLLGPVLAGTEITHVETGRRLRYEFDADTLVLDCKAGLCTTGGQDRTGNLSARDWFSVAPGATATLAWNGVTTMSVAFAPAYY